jgi:DNA-binding transcriptional LysR family regulator
MTWDDYDVFCRVVEQGGFSAAGRAMGRPRSSISASVMRLEHELQTRLLERTTRRLRMTEAGESLYQTMGPLFIQLREARMDLAAQEGTVYGVLRMASPYEFAAHHLAAAACQVLACHPQLHMQIDIEYARVSPLERPYDIVFTLADVQTLTAGTIARRVFSLQPAVYAAPSLLQGREAPSRPEDLNDFPLIATSTEVEWRFVGPGGEPHSVAMVSPRLRTSHAGVRLQAAIAGIGIARVGAASYAEQAVREGLLQPVLPGYACMPVPVYALLPGQRHMPAKVRVFLDTLSERLPGPGGH